ncbi:MAG: hypothetical protein JO043_10605, partial [Candidatus Eremiobacteraeota bacterium]|nr:hypothetical protein [Candidatus Eremiobacteraeota bacterium]
MSIRSLCCLCAFQSIAAFLSGCQSSARGGDAALVPAELHGAGAHRFSMASVRGPLSVVDPAPSAAMLESAAPHPRWMRFAAEGLPAYAWVSQFNLSSVSEYHKNNRRNAPPVCNIAGQPYVNGLGV